MDGAKILLVDDELDILEFLSYNLKKAHYQVFTASNGIDALDIARKEVPDLIILDVMMPEMDGIETCVELRNIPMLSNVVIAFLTARGEDYSQIAGLEAGADDYISKPIKPRLFISRVKALLRRKLEAKTKVDNETNQGIIIDREKYLIFKEGKEYLLPKKEFELIALLTSRPGKVFTRDEILSGVWGNDIVVGERTIDVHVRKLREKFSDLSIKTIKGVGYKYDPD